MHQSRGVCQFPKGPWGFRTWPFPAAVSPLGMETRNLFPSSQVLSHGGKWGDAERLHQSELGGWLLWWGTQGEPPPPLHAHWAGGHGNPIIFN